MSPSRILGEEMNELKDLADKSLAIRILDHEPYGTKIQQIFQRVKEATTSFFVRTIYVHLMLYIFTMLVPSAKWRLVSSKRRVRYATTPR